MRVAAGRYQADLERVTTTADPGRGRWLLVCEAVTDRAVRLTVRQPLADGESADPFDLSPGQRRALRAFAADLGIDATRMAPRDVAGRVEGMVGGRVAVRVRVNTQRGTVHCRLHAAHDGPGPRDGDLDAARAALIDARRRADQGLVGQFEACWALRELFDERPGAGSVTDYLDSQGVRMRRSAFYERAAIWCSFVREGGVDPARLAGVQVGRLARLCHPLDEGLVDAEDAIRNAETLGRAEFRAWCDGLHVHLDRAVAA